MDAADFETQLASLIKSAISRRVPIVNVVHILDAAANQVRLGVNQAYQELSAREAANRIIPSSTIPEK